MTQKIHTSNPNFTKNTEKKILLHTLVIASVCLASVGVINLASAEGEEDLSKYQNMLANNLPPSNKNQADEAKRAEQKAKQQAEQSAKQQAEKKAKQLAEAQKIAKETPTVIANDTAETTTIVPRVEQEPLPTFSELTQAPNESNLSFANRELLTNNAQLERDVNDLKTQVNVLVNERSGQLFMYGVYTALASFLGGGFLSYLIFGRRKNNW